jgi:hypothetical protein
MLSGGIIWNNAQSALPLIITDGYRYLESKEKASGGHDYYRQKAPFV